MGSCTQELRAVPQNFFEGLSSRLGIAIEDKSKWCNTHRLFFSVTIQRRCAFCLVKKPSTSLRSAMSWRSNSNPLEKICTACTIKPEPLSIAFLQTLIEEDFFIMPVATTWYKMIIDGKKLLKFFAKKVSQKSIGKIVLMRAVTPDQKSRMIVGAIILGDHDPNAPLDPRIGYLGKWKLAYPIKHYIPFSPFRCFSCNAWAGGTPKQIKDVDVIANAKRALEVVCGSRPDFE
jgi:hypothetical protein